MIVEFFSCSGGMAEGARACGLTSDVAFDLSADACDSYERNLGHRPIQANAEDMLCLARAGHLRFGEIDLLIADPPCTPWSRAGNRRGLDDERDMLPVAVELVRVLRPRAYLIANVPGLDDGPNWHIVQDTIGSLARDGYCARDYARLDAADYGVPQHRVRPFWFGHLDGPCLRWPGRTHGAPEECAHPTLPGYAHLRPWVTCRDALSHLSPEDLGQPIKLRWRGQNGEQHGSVPDRPARVVGTSERLLFGGPNHRPSRAGAPARTLTRNTHSDGALLVHDRHPINLPDAPPYCVTTKGGACVMAWPWDRPSTTVTAARDVVPPPGHHGPSFLSQPGAIKLSERAAAILQGFPESWHFEGKTKAARWSQIGQAMPPGLAEPVFRAIAAQMMAPRG